MRQTNCRWAWIPIILVFLSVTCFAQTTADSQELTPGKPIERELGGGGVHLYSIKVEAGQFLKAVVDQRGIDVVLTLISPGGSQLLETDSPNGKQGPESVSYVARSSGAHQIKVHSAQKAAAAGRYEIKIDALRAATVQEKLESEAKELAKALASAKTDEERATLLVQKKELVTVELVRALYEHGRDFRNQRKFPQALALSRFALSLAEQLGDKTGIADCFYNIGYSLYLQGETAPALEYLQRSLVMREELGERVKAGDSSGVLGSLYNRQLNSSKALEFYRRSLTHYEEAGDKEGIARVLASMGQLLRNQANHTQALEVFQRLLALRTEQGDKTEMANAMLNVGFFHQMLGNFALALEYRQKALALGEELGNKALIAGTFFNLGHLYRVQSDYARSLEYFHKELKLREELGNKALMVTALFNVGQINRLSGNLPQALEYFQKALSLSETLPDKGILAQTLSNLGTVYRSQSDFAEAREYFQRELKIREEQGDKAALAVTLNNLGWVHRFLGNYAEALEHYRKSLKLSEEGGNKLLIAEAHAFIGEIYYLQGDYAQALEEYRESLKRFEEVGAKRGIANTLHRIGIVQLLQGDDDLALDYFQRDLKLREELGVRTTIADTLNTIGIVHYNRKNYALATEYMQKSLELQEQSGVKRGVAISQAGLASVLRNQENYARAMDYYQRNLKLIESIGDKELLAGALGDMAETFRLQGDLSKALEFSDRATIAAREITSREVLWQSRLTAGRAYRVLNRTDEARAAFEEAIVEVESLRSKIVGHASRSSYFATVQQTYELYTDLLMQLHKLHPSAGHDEAALQVSERARARSLLEALSEARADLRRGVDPVLVQRERSLQQRLNATAERQTRLLTTKHTEEQIAEVKKEIAALTAEFQDVQAQIRQRSPRYAALTQPVPLGLGEIQQLLDPETSLLEYSLGDERSYLWMVSPNSIKSFELPKRADIETSVRRVVQLLNDGQRWATSKEIDSEYAAAATELSDTLLPTALMSQLKAKRLVIVSDGALQYLPFSALPLPRMRGSRASRQKSAAVTVPRRQTAKLGVSTSDSRLPLIAQYEIVSLPSASTLAVLRRETANRARAVNSVAVLADPVFEQNDERIKTPVGQARPSESLQSSSRSIDKNYDHVVGSRSLLERAFRFGSHPATDGSLRETLRIGRLPFTRFEAEGILEAAPPNQSMKATDFRANRETATSAALATYRYVHFATHGILNSEHPELSGVVLSLVNEKGEPVDGFLRLHEIYNLNLPADLVVLSACQTGLGKEIRGEGLVGLTRGFMYAGAPRVVASLWKVDDAATAELMKRFYRGMLKENLRPAAALRQAKVEMWKQKRWNAPFYWAAFELQGEWK